MLKWLLRTSIVLILLIGTTTIINADKIDDAIKETMNNEYIRGAAIAFYDGSNSSNIINKVGGYGKLSSSAISKDVTADTAFMLASVSKIFVGIAVVKLIDLGIIKSLDDDICNVIPSTWNKSACRNPKYSTIPITWRMLVTHHSSLVEDIPTLQINGQWVEASYGPTGWTNVDGDKAYGNPTCPLLNTQSFYHTVLTTDINATTNIGGGKIDWYNEFHNNNEGTWMNYKPGSKYAYSNFAYGYLSALLELATNQTFESFSQQYIFIPLGMKNTSWARETLPNTTLVAMPVEENDNGGYSDIGHFCFIDFTSGSLYSSVNDLSKFLKSMLKKGIPELWSSSNLGDLIFSCQLLDEDECNIGITWELLYNNDKNKFSNRWLNLYKKYDWTGAAWHDGVEDGVSTIMFIFPKSNTYAISLTNTENSASENLLKATLKTHTTNSGSKGRFSFRGLVFSILSHFIGS